MKSSPHLHAWLSSLSLVSPVYHGAWTLSPSIGGGGAHRSDPAGLLGMGFRRWGRQTFSGTCVLSPRQGSECVAPPGRVPPLRGEVHPSPDKSQGPGLDGASGHLWGEAVPVLCVVSPQGVLESGSIQHTLIPHPQRRSPPKEVTMKSLGSDAGHSSGSCRGCDPSTMEQEAPPCLAPAPFSQEFRGVVRG